MYLGDNPQLGDCARNVRTSRECQELLAELGRRGLLTRIPWGEWTPQVHMEFPERVRADIFQLLLVLNSLPEPLRLPNVLKLYMIMWVATRW